MRSIRRAAIAGATAAALSLGAATAATADETVKAEVTVKDDSNKDGTIKDKMNDLSEKANRKVSGSAVEQLEIDKPANGGRLFGSTNEAKNEPKWAQYMKIVTIVAWAGTFLGLVAFPAYNFMVANHLLPGQAPR